MVVKTPISKLVESIKSTEVISSLKLSLETAGAAAIISLIFGTPLSYILARKNFWGKGLIEGIVDIPIVIPHPVVGIAMLSVFGKDVFPGNVLQEMGITILGTKLGIITVLTFVGLPFYVDTVRNAIEMIPERLEKVSRSLGASTTKTFIRITLPLSKRSMLSGALMCMARAISEFGAVVVVAYHPMVASVLIFERFESYGLKEARPVAVILIVLSVLLFLAIRTLATGNGKGSLKA